MIKKSLSLLIFPAMLLTSSVSAQDKDKGQSIKFDATTQIPSAALRAGDYVFSLEERLPDRAIVRVADPQDTNHYLFLAVPNRKLEVQASDHLAYFKSAEGKAHALKGWKCADCSAPLEFVYPKEEAVPITAASGGSVLAVDPSYDKLSQSLSPDDMKVVTLWLLSPERITSAHTGEGVKAAKYSAAKASGVEMAKASPRQELPRTAGHDYLYLVCGAALLAGGALFRKKGQEQN